MDATSHGWNRAGYGRFIGAPLKQLLSQGKYPGKYMKRWKLNWNFLERRCTVGFPQFDGK